METHQRRSHPRRRRQSQHPRGAGTRRRGRPRQPTQGREARVGRGGGAGSRGPEAAEPQARAREGSEATCARGCTGRPATLSAAAAGSGLDGGAGTGWRLLPAAAPPRPGPPPLTPPLSLPLHLYKPSPAKGFQRQGNLTCGWNPPPHPPPQFLQSPQPAGSRLINPFAHPLSNPTPPT